MDTRSADDSDYYQILGVMRTATAADISAAYHLLARRHHPDVSPVSNDSLARIKLINEAYEVLSDAEKRRDYDRRHPSRAAPPSIPHGYQELARSSFARSTTPAAASSTDVEVELPIAPEEARYGGLCEFMLTLHEVCAACAGQGQVAGSWCACCQGHGRTRERRRLQIRLPGGVQTGTLIRLPRPDANWLGSAGELLLRIKVRPCW